MDDDAIYVYDFSDEVCDEFMAKYASALGTPQSTQWDYEANTSTYPGAGLVRVPG